MEFGKRRRERRAAQSYEWTKENQELIRREQDSRRRIEEAIGRLSHGELPTSIRLGEDEAGKRWAETVDDSETTTLVWGVDGLNLHKQSHTYPFTRANMWIVDIPTDDFTYFPYNCIGHRCFIEAEHVDGPLVLPFSTDTVRIEEEINAAFLNQLNASSEASA